jgi:uncharacterized protein (DUF983 family)
LNYPKVIFTYMDVMGMETSISADIMGCCPECETEHIFEKFQDFINLISETIADKYIDEDNEDLEDNN